MSIWPQQSATTLSGKGIEQLTQSAFDAMIFRGWKLRAKAEEQTYPSVPNIFL